MSFAEQGMKNKCYLRPFLHTTITFIFSTIFYVAMMLVKDIGWIPLLILTGIYISILVLASINIQWNFYFRSYNKGKNKKWISLTFDDGPAEQTNAILDILKEQRVTATFFSIGKNAVANQDIVRRWKNEGHIIGNHSYTHGFNFDWQSINKMSGDIEEANAAIKNIIGKKPRLFRPPYGVTNPNLGRAVKDTKMYSIGWNVRSFDTTAKDPKRLLAHILRKVKGGDVILLHDSMTITKLILTELIIKLHQKGYSFVGIDKLFDIEPYE